MRTETSEWVKNAEADFRSAALEFRAPEPNFDATCFHAQQCAEMYLKALLQEQNQAFPKTHDLELLLDLLLPAAPELSDLRPPARALAGHSVEFRYPGVRRTKRLQDALSKTAARSVNCAGVDSARQVNQSLIWA